MHLARHRAWLRPGIVLPVLAVIAALAVIGCNLVNDSLTGVRLDKASPSACIKSCVNDWDGQLKAEIDRHQAAIRACQSSSKDHGACERAEAAQHQSEMERISNGRRDCMNNCHRQGSGSAG